MQSRVEIKLRGGWLNSDDLYMPGALARAVRAFAEHPEAGVVFGDWLSADADDRVLSMTYAFDFNLNQFKYEGFFLNAQSMFWRKDVHKRFGGFDTALYRTMDYQMILAFGINEGEKAFFRVPEALGVFRRHEEQKTQGFDGQVDSEHRMIAARYDYADKYRFIGKVKRFFYRFRRAYWYYKRGGIGYLVNQVVRGS